MTLIEYLNRKLHRYGLKISLFLIPFLIIIKNKINT